LDIYDLNVLLEHHQLELRNMQPIQPERFAFGSLVKWHGL